VETKVRVTKTLSEQLTVPRSQNTFNHDNIHVFHDKMWL